MGFDLNFQYCHWIQSGCCCETFKRKSVHQMVHVCFISGPTIQKNTWMFIVRWHWYSTWTICAEDSRWFMCCTPRIQCQSGLCFYFIFCKFRVISWSISMWLTVYTHTHTHSPVKATLCPVGFFLFRDSALWEQNGFNSIHFPGFQLSSFSHNCVPWMVKHALLRTASLHKENAVFYFMLDGPVRRISILQQTQRRPLDMHAGAHTFCVISFFELLNRKAQIQSFTSTVRNDFQEIYSRPTPCRNNYLTCEMRHLA